MMDKDEVAHMVLHLLCLQIQLFFVVIALNV